MHTALSDFLTYIKAIERTIDLRADLVAFGQAPPNALNSAGTALRRSIRRVGLVGMQPSLDGAVLLIAAAFEQFVSDVMVAFAADLPNVVPQYRSLPGSVQSANERLTGEALNRSRARFTGYELQRFVDNLRNCQVGLTPYVLNGEAIALNSSNLNPGVLRELMSRLGPQDVWTDMASTRALKNWSGRGGAKVAKSRAQNQLSEIIRNRNQIAHRVGGTTPGPEVIRSYIRFERALARSLVKSLENYAMTL